jgi:peptidoglycan/xylan/chitin deacetylase (PgdA/CDA1 family)
VNISITFDVEIWCKGWKSLNKDFPDAFQRYIYGTGANGYALPKTLEILNRNRLKGVFFVESLFSYRFGIERLQAIVDLIIDAGHEIQLHIHPEWANEVDPPLVPGVTEKRRQLSDYTLSEQTSLIRKGIEALERCGAARPTAFRAGNYSCNLNTLRALAANRIAIDSSINQTYSSSKVYPSAEDANLQPHHQSGVLEYPVTVFRDGIGKRRHWQVGSTGYRESVILIKAARNLGYRHLVLVSHNFEMLKQGSGKPDWIAVSRFSKLCRWLDAHRDDFPVSGLPINAPHYAEPKADLSVPLAPTAARLGAQAMRRIITAISN